MNKKLNDGIHVANFSTKAEDNGRPSIFIGSSSESKVIVDEVNRLFGKTEFEVDPWYDGIFGATKSEDENNGLSIMEWLTNFTDIYDYAIFIFVPEDRLESAVRTDENDKIKSASVTQHNVVLEFGMFLGKIGAKRCFILMDEDTVDSIQKFFSDLKENLDDGFIEFNKGFKLEIHRYKGYYQDYLEDLKNSKNSKKKPFDSTSLSNAVEKIKGRIKDNFKTIQPSFLPGTSLAFGYYNNFLAILLRGIIAIRRKNKVYKENIDNWRSINGGLKEEVQLAIEAAKKIEIRIVIPTTLEGAKQKTFTKDFEKRDYNNYHFPGYNRPVNAICDKNALNVENETFIMYDIPTTMNSSIKAIDMLNPKEDIRELLKIKEIRNFKRTLELIIEKKSAEEGMAEIKDMIKIIDVKDFGSVADLLAK